MLYLGGQKLTLEYFVQMEGLREAGNVKSNITNTSVWFLRDF